MTAFDGGIREVSRPYNRPGLDELSYRVGDYHRFRQKLVSALSQPVLPGGPSLATLTTRSSDDGAIALLDAWSIMADVLTFYQERIANEGFLNTATERLSVLELARSIGYELKPGVAASTFLSFEVEAIALEVDPTIVIPTGTQVESVPGEDELPQLFETVTEIVARPEWNAIAPRPTRPQSITDQATELRLNGTDTQLQSGDWVLLIDEHAPDHWQLLPISEVVADRADSQTLIRWTQPPISNSTEQRSSRLYSQPQVWAFRQSARLFGSEAPQWQSLPGETKRAALEAAAQNNAEEGDHVPVLHSGVFSSTDDGETWQALSTGLPDKDIFSLAALDDGTLLAATAGSGIFRRRRGDVAWQPASAGLDQLTVLTLTVEGAGEDATIYAGTGGGGLYRSKDGGDTWVGIHTGRIRVESTGGNEWASVNNSLPSTVVRAVGTVSFASSTYTLAGTDNGLYFCKEIDLERTWQRIPASAGFVIKAFQHNTASGQPGAVIASDRGVYEVLHTTSGEIPLGLRLSIAEFEEPAQTFWAGDRELIAGTPTGISVYRGWQEPREDRGGVERRQSVEDRRSGKDRRLSIKRRLRGRKLLSGQRRLSVRRKVSERRQISRERRVGGERRFEERREFQGQRSQHFPLDTSVQALVSTPSNLLAATPKGIFALKERGTNWQFDQPVKLPVDTLTLVTASDGTIYSGSRFIEPATDALNPISAESAGVENAASSARQTQLNQAKRAPSNWPGFNLKTARRIDLDTLYPQVISPSWLALIDTVDEEVKGEIAAVTAAQSTPRKDFGLDTQITRLTLSSALENPAQFSLRNTQVLAQSEQIELALEPLTVAAQQHKIFQDPLRGKQIFLSRYVAHLQPQQSVLIRGKHLRAEVVSVGGVFSARSPQPDQFDTAPWNAQNTGLTTTNIRALAIAPNQQQIYAGTDEGIFVASLPTTESSFGLTWRPLNQGLLNKSVQCLVIQENGSIYAGTSDGIFRLATGGDRWTQAHQGLTHPNVYALVGAGDRLYAATGTGRDERSPRGVFCLLDNQADEQTGWHSTGLTNIDVQTLAVQQNGETFSLWAGTLEQGLFYSDNSGDSWQALPQWEEGEGLLESEGEWVRVTVDQPDLRVGDTIRASGQIREVVEVRRENEPFEFRVSEPFRPDLLAKTPFSIGTGLTNPRVTALLIDQAEERETVVFAGTAGSGVFRSGDREGRWQAVGEKTAALEIRCLAKGENGRIWAGTQLNGIFYSENEGETWLAYSQDLHNTAVHSILPMADRLLAAGSGTLLNTAGNYAVPLQVGDILQVVKPPQSKTPNVDDLAAPDLTEGGWWTVRNREGFTGRLTTVSPSDLKLLPAAETDAWVSEKGEIDYPPEDQRHPIFTLVEPLQYSYDPATVTIAANVALATHGETVGETLGSGDGTRSRQTFTLQQPPLTYTAGQSIQLNSSLQVRVNGILWQEVNSLYGAKPHDPIYTVKLEDDGTPHISFGDGIAGARLPTGLENITATYRTGSGLDGEVDAEKLTLLKTKPLGLVASNNPLPAIGAAPPETLQTARTKAPATLRTLDRIVSLSDFEDFARAYPGIGKAQAIAVWTGRAQWVHITIAGLDNSSQSQTLDETSRLYEELVAAIDRNRDPIQQMQVNFSKVERFNLAARVLIDSVYEEHQVMEQVTASLQAMFAFEQRAFGQAVTASEAIAAIQSVAGVVAVDLDALYRFGQSKNRRTELPATTAYWDAQLGEILPAQLLLLNPNGIELKAVTRL